MEISENKQFSLEEVINITANLLGAKPEELTEKVNDIDLSSVESLNSFLKPFYVKKFNDLREESLNKGYRQASKKTERLWGEIFNQDISGKKLDDLFMETKEQLSNKSDKSKNITIQQALNSQEVRQYIETLKSKAEQVEQVKNEFNSYKNLQQIKQDALNELTKRGAKFSENQKIKRLQLQALEEELSQIKFKRNNDGSIIILDEDGESPLYNKETASHWQFGDYVANLSPVDFVSEVKKENKTTFVPSQTGNSVNNFGYTKDQISKFTYDDFKRANKAGKNDEAKFIQEQMINNYENQNK
jgi:hypothetical protein